MKPKSPVKPVKRSLPFMIMSVYFFSGVCSLMDEVIWVRLLKLVLGNTVYASSIVVSTFMGGLALGALIMGPVADRVSRRLRLYAILEMLITVSALAFPLGLRAFESLYQFLFVRFHPSASWLTVMQIVFSVILLIIPTLLMGSTLPLLARAVTGMKEKTGPLVGRLYMLNMLGAALGCFSAGFLFIAQAGIWGTILIAAGINLLVALAGWLLSVRYDKKENTEKPVSVNEDKSSEAVSVTSFGQVLLLCGFFISGLVSIGYEMIWMRSVVFVLGGPTYVFSSVLTVYLLGNVIGAAVSSRIAGRIRNPASGFGKSLSLLGLSGIVFLPVFLWMIPNLFQKLFSSITGLLSDPVFEAMAVPMIFSIVLFLVPSMIMGFGFPLALQAWSAIKFRVGKTTGTVYGINTIGSVLGGILAGFILIPRLGVQGSVLLLGIAGGLLGVLMVIFTQKQTRLRLIWAAAGMAMIALTLAVPRGLFTRHLVRETYPDAELLDVKEGISTTVSVHRQPSGNLILATSGIQVAGDGEGFRSTQKILGHLGILLNRNTKQVLSVGFGSGESSTCMSRHAAVQVEVVEISPEVVDISLNHFTHLNHGKSTPEKIRITYMDAKNFLRLTDRKYDLIVTDSINPKQVAENASLYTKEYFSSALDRLENGGLVGCWLPIEELPLSCIYSVLETFSEVFPHVTLWFPVTVPSDYDFIFLVGSPEPQSFSPRAMDAALESPDVRSSIAYIHVTNSVEALAGYLGDETDLARCDFRKYPVNSDTRPYIEFNTDVTEPLVFKKNWTRDWVRKLQSGSLSGHLDWTGFTDKERQEWVDRYKSMRRVADTLLKTRFEKDLLSALYYCSRELKNSPGQASLIRQMELILQGIRRNIDSGRVDLQFILGDVNQFIDLDRHFSGAWLIKSWILDKMGDGGAMNAAVEAARITPDFAQAHHTIGLYHLGNKKVDQALASLEKAAGLRPDVFSFQMDLGKAHLQNRDYPAAKQAFLKAEALRPSDTRVRSILKNLHP